MYLDLLLKFHTLFYIGYLVVFLVLITRGEKIADYLEKRKGKPVRVTNQRRTGVRSRFIP